MGSNSKRHESGCWENSLLTSPHNHPVTVTFSLMFSVFVHPLRDSLCRYKQIHLYIFCLFYVNSKIFFFYFILFIAKS